MILAHGTNSLQHGFTPKPIPTGFTRVYGVKSAYRNTAFTLDISSLGITNQDLESVMVCYITPFECKPYGERPYATNNVCPWCKSTIEFYNSSGNTYRVYLINGGGNRASTFATTDTSFGGRKTIVCKNNLMSINGSTWTTDSRAYAVTNLTSLYLWGPFDNDIYTPITIYEVTVKKGDTIYAHLVPVRDESTGHPNFFDEVSGRVMTPQLEPTSTNWSLFEVIDGVEIGGRMYPTVQMPDGREWLGLNLDFAWEGLPVGGSGMPSTPNAWYNFNDESTWGWNGHKCGLLYNGAAISYLESNEATLIPGWHVPTYAEWGDLFVAVGGTSVGGTKLKATNDVAYPMYNANWNGTDDYGMSILPSGYRWASDSFVNGVNNGSRYAVSNVSNYAGFDSSASTGRWTHDSAEGIAIRLIKDAT